MEDKGVSLSRKDSLYLIPTSTDKIERNVEYRPVLEGETHRTVATFSIT